MIVSRSVKKLQRLCSRENANVLIDINKFQSFATYKIMHDSIIDKQNLINWKQSQCPMVIEIHKI